jgi:single stranded DNA-binding protein
MLNKIFIMGRLTRDPELRRTQSGTAVTSFSLAVDRDYKSQSGEKETDFIDVVAWRSTAEFVSKYFTKGRMAVVEGRLQIHDWKDKDGNNRHSAEVVADHHNLIDAIERCDLAAFEPLVERHLYGGIRRLGSKLTEEYADYFE